MLKLKRGYRSVFLFLSIVLLQSCALNDKHQLNEIFESSRTTINNLKQTPFTEKDIAAGLKEALKIAAERVVFQLGKRDGYLSDQAIHISLPANLQKVHSTLQRVGLERYTKELEVKMNRAAEISATKAKNLFWLAINDMRWQDIQVIYKGKPDAATQYFKKKMTPSLKRMMKPIIEQSLSSVGVIKEYKKVIEKYHKIPFVPRVNEDLSGYVMEKGMRGLFYYLAREEAAIRTDPVKRTTVLLKRVFGS